MFCFFFFLPRCMWDLSSHQGLNLHPWITREFPPITLILIWVTNTGAQGFGDQFLVPTWSSLLGRRHLWLWSWCYRKCDAFLCSAVKTHSDQERSIPLWVSWAGWTACDLLGPILAFTGSFSGCEHLLWSKVLSLLAEAPMRMRESLKNHKGKLCLCAKRGLSPG